MRGNFAETGKRLPAVLPAVLLACALSGFVTRLFAQGTFDQELMNLARQSERFGRLEEAEKLCRQILANDPMNQYAHHRLGVMAAARGDLDLAIAHFTAAERGGPPSPQLLNDYGGVLYLKGNLTTAEQKLRAALTLDPKNQDAGCNLQLVLAKQQAVAAAAAEERAAAESLAAQERQAAAKAMAAAKAAARAREIAEVRAAMESQAASQAIAEAKMTSRLRAIAEARKQADNARYHPVETPRPVSNDKPPGGRPDIPLPRASAASFRMTDLQPTLMPYPPPPLQDTSRAANRFPDGDDQHEGEVGEDNEGVRDREGVLTGLKRLFKRD